MSETGAGKTPEDAAPVVAPADPRASWAAHEEEIAAAIERTLRSGRYILGPEVEAFEREWAAYLGAGYAVGVANGTDALELALRAAGIVPGDLVVTAANTVSATAAGIERAGARLGLADVDPVSLTISPSALDEWLESRDAPQVRALVPVHLYGQPADLPALEALARKHGFILIEDCAQAHGAAVGGRKAGTWGIAAGFSFYPTKNLGALGDGGAVVTRDVDLAERVRLLRQYGWRARYVSDEPGFNSRLDELQAAVLRVKLRFLEAETRRRGEIAERYLRELSNLPDLVLPREVPGSVCVWHQFVVRHRDRAGLYRHLERAGVHAGILYPEPIHRQPAYRGRVQLPPGGLAHAEQACAELLCLPIHPQLSDEQVGRVVAAVGSFSEGCN